MKKIYTILLLFALAGSAFSAKLENLPFMSDVHTGIVYGPGMGIDLGATAWVFLRSVKVGLEVEILMTDADYTATINATRYGGLLGTKISNYTANLHFGALSFTSTRLITFKDMAGIYQTINENVSYKGNYMGVSIDIPAGEFILSPKYIVNTIANKGSLAEFDLNIGKSF